MKNHEEFFFISMFCSVLGGGFLGAGHGWFAAFYFLLAIISVTLKWIFIAAEAKK